MIYLQVGGPSMPGDLEDLLGGLPPSKPSNSSKPRYCKLNVWLTNCKFVWSILFFKLTLDVYSRFINRLSVRKLVQNSQRQLTFNIDPNLFSGCLEAGRHLRHHLSHLRQATRVPRLHLRQGLYFTFSVHQGWNRVLVSLFSWPGQLLSLNPCRRPKILARMLFLRILSLTVVIADVTA